MRLAMKIDILGREKEFHKLEENYCSKKSGLVTIYGRRRIGKSFFLNAYCLKHRGLYFEGLEKEHTSTQIQHFKKQLSKQVNDPLLKLAQFTTWEQIFDFLTDFFEKTEGKNLLIFDEFQWIAAGHTKLVSLLKFYWDNHWKRANVQLILCGSISSYMIGKVIKSKALYGRIDIEIKMGPLDPKNVSLLLKNKISKDEVLKYMLVFGGVPKYIDLINTKYSFNKNMELLCFEKDSYFSTEFEKIFYSQFRKHRLHEKIVLLLAKENLALEEIAKKLKMSSSGGLKRYLTELEDASFIRTASFNETKGKKYKLFDEYLIFYFKFIRPQLKIIKYGYSKNLFSEQIKTTWTSWTGIAFENFCLKNLNIIAKIIEVEGKIKNFGPFFKKESYGIQIDLLIQTIDNNLYVFECKYSINPVDASIIKDFEKKIKALENFKNLSIKKVLISANGATKELQASEYFDFIITKEDFLK